MESAFWKTRAPTVRFGGHRTHRKHVGYTLALEVTVVRAGTRGGQRAECGYQIDGSIWCYFNAFPYEIQEHSEEKASAQVTKARKWFSTDIAATASDCGHYFEKKPMLGNRLFNNPSVLRRVRVMHIVDSLRAGGRERMAVNLVNSLSRDRFSVYLCTTRGDGPLAEFVKQDVGRLRLERRARFDLMALPRLIAFNQAQRIQILHAHDASLFLAGLASLCPPYPAVIWHDHFGGIEERSTWPVWLYRFAIKSVRGVIVVNPLLAEWSRERLRVAPERIWYVPNFVCSSGDERTRMVAVPGSSGHRIICVANINAYKDHVTLVRAMAAVIREMPPAHLLLVGSVAELEQSDAVRGEIARYGLQRHISILGERRDVYPLLKTCDIGVLSSVSEGLPMALIEYGMAGLAAVATRVGQCPEVMDNGRAGIIVPPASPEKLAEGLVSLLKSPERRIALGKQFQRRVKERYSADAVMKQVCQIYDQALGCQ